MSFEVSKEIEGILMEAPDNYGVLIGRDVIAITNRNQRLVLTFFDGKIITSPIIKMNDNFEQKMISFITRSGSTYSIKL